MDQWVVIDMMKMDQWVSIDTWWRWIDVVSLVYDALLEKCIDDSIIILSWLIGSTNGWTPKWSPYGESPHGKTLCGLSYPRRMVGGPMLSLFSYHD